jgi:hypothetical protein
MARGKIRSPEEIQRMQRDIRRQYRPLLRKMEVLEIREKTLDWVMGGDDQFGEQENTEFDGALDSLAETEGEPSE